MNGTKLELLERRKLLLQDKWWLKRPDVSNTEWLYLLETETRNSIMIEWYFTKESELKKVIHTNDTTAEHADKILWYYSTATMLYEFAYQKFKANEKFSLRESDINTMHSLLFKWTDSRIAWKLRVGDIRISWAEIKPIVWALTHEAMKYVTEFSTYVCEQYDIVTASAMIHVLFESLHMYEDGNWRTWRILLNYILLSHWLPNIIIKWTDLEKNKYITSLEAWEKGLYTFLPKSIPENTWIEEWNFDALKKIIIQWLYASLDRMILEGEDENTLVPLVEISQKLGFSEEYARKLAQRWKVIAKKKINYLIL